MVLHHTATYLACIARERTCLSGCILISLQTCLFEVIEVSHEELAVAP